MLTIKCGYQNGSKYLKQEKQKINGNSMYALCVFIYTLIESARQERTEITILKY